MKKTAKYFLTLITLLVGTGQIVTLTANANSDITSPVEQNEIEVQLDTTLLDEEIKLDKIINLKSLFNKNKQEEPREVSDSLPYAFKDENDNMEFESQNQSLLYLKDPSNMESTIKYDSHTGNYILMKKIGTLNYRRPLSMTKKEYQEYEFRKSLQDYWAERGREDNPLNWNKYLPKLKLNGQAFGGIFGSAKIQIKPQGSAELSFGVNTTKVDNPTLPENLRKTSSFDFDEKIQMNVFGSIGEKLKMDVNYNTEATFDFENTMRLEHIGEEDDIIRRIEAGNVSLPLSSTLITGGQNLFGIKTELQFGRLNVTSVFSQQKGETTVVEMEKGAQKNEFEISADNYEVNRHFFLSKYFRDHFDEALKILPVINSGVTINKVEVWITNKTANFQNARNIIAFVDLAENGTNISNPNLFTQIGAGTLPENNLNNLYDQMATGYSAIRDINQVTSTLLPLAPGFTAGKDYEKVENARKLSESEYTLNRKLGFISLNQALNADEVLAVAFEYTVGGKSFRVGEFTSDGVSSPQTLIVKLLKGTNLSPQLPTWDLMMKNIYNVGAFQVNREDFILNILYQNDEAGTAVNYLSEGNIAREILLSVMNMDNLNSQLDPKPDGVFDFIEGITIYSSNGRIIFPVLEPFGSYLRKKIGNDAIAEKIVFEELYRKTQNEAQQIAEKNKFLLKGSYKSSSSSEISLNALNVQQGSVKVMAGGLELVENIDYTVDYTLGRVKIINQSLLESGTPIKISSENNSLFNIQTKTLLGTHLDYRFSKDFNLGATIMHLSERPLTQKVNIGDEPIANTIFGVNGAYRTESYLLTTLIDKLPFIESKEPSTIAIEGEFAKLSPGHNRGIGKSGTAYIDDFEGSETSIDMKNMNAWVLASTPQNQEQLFPEGNLNNDLSYGFNRAKLAWYVIDPLFLRSNSATPGHIKRDKDQQSNHFVREIHENEIFPNKDTPTGIPANIAVLNMAFYPSEKGPYNYDVDGNAGISFGMNPDGTLKDPQTRWGGIMRKIETNDFEAANIEYIEFWLMDPFVYDSGHSGGDLYFNLGNISEDVLQDSRKSFENGLPTSNNATLVDTTVWGRVPLVQSLVNAFDNNNTSRQFQDVGMDGLSTENELSFFQEAYLNKISSSANLGSGSEAYQLALQDPSSDDYHYFRGSDYDALEVSILERYKKFNGLEGNSPTSENSSESYPTSATTLPDVEDINHDNTLSETESYYQYRVRLKPDEMKVGQNFIVDKITSTVRLANGEEGSVNWYQFKVPITDFEEQIGNISDFKSIRFMRIFLRNFNEEVILRFARLDLVRDDWRRYQQSLLEDAEINPDTKFDVSAVNIEENASKQPVNYILPPGIDRVVDPRNPQLRQLNEQSILLKVIDLEDGDARAVYKNLNMDIRQYKRLKMDVHAEEIEGYGIDNREIHAFIRMGTDYQNNYYEYEIPLKLTLPGRYQNDSDEDRLEVWPEENRFDLALKVFQTIKQLRNDEMRQSGSSVSFATVYQVTLGDLENDKDHPRARDIIRISGNPNLANIRTIMIGIRNPSKETNPNSDDGTMKSGEVWFNEFRLTDFDEKGGWAANLRVTTKLADLGTLTWAGSRSTAGFGGIEQGVNERKKEDAFQYDFSTNLELGKFFPEKSGIKVPLYFAMSEQIINPEYNPLDPDIPLDIALENAANNHVRDSIKRIAQDYTRRKSFNLTNVRIEKQKGKPRIWDISNLSLIYSYNETYMRNVNTVRNLEKNYRGVLNYNFSNRPKNVEPFKKLKTPILQMFRDFNFYYMPTQLSFRSDISRHYHEILNRNIENPDLIIEPTFNKDFIWNRYYDLKYNITKNLKFDFSATNTSRIDEPDGVVDKKRDRDAYEHWKDSVWNNILDGGRNVQYHHNFTFTYTLPINKLPWFNWTSVTARYSGTYDWNAGAITVDTIELGNTIRNSNNIQVNGQLNFVNFYNKAGFLKKINQKYNRGRKITDSNKKFREVNYRETIAVLKANIPRNIYHKLSTRDVDVKVYDPQGKEIKVKMTVVSPSRVRITSSKLLKNARVRITGKIAKKDNVFLAIGETLLRTLMSVRNLSASYSEVNGTTLPGYLPETRFFGGENFNGTTAPGWEFLVGHQNEDFANRAAASGWLTTDSTLNLPYMMSHTQNFTLRSTIEPIKGLKIDVTANRNFSKNQSEYYIYNEDENKFTATNHLESGNFTMSFLSLKSAFFAIGNTGDYSSKYFEEFLKGRKSESLRLAKKRYGENYVAYEIPDENGKGTGFFEGYGPTAQEVLIPAFLNAYGGSSNYKKLFPTLLQIKPNWRITFDGLSKINWIRRYLKSINVNHAYRSSYNLGSYTTNLNYIADQFGFSEVISMEGNFLPRYEVNSVSINEQFNPLFNIDMIWVNNLTTRFEIKRTRNLNLSLANTQLTEVASNEIVFGLGYRFNNFGMIIGSGSRQKRYENDLNLRGDLSIRKNSTIIRKIVDEVDQLTSGQKVVTLKVSADYVLSNRLNLRLFYDRIVNTPFVSLAYPTTNTNFGISVRFTLTQ